MSSKYETLACTATAPVTPRAIKATLDRGIKELTGATDAVEGWKHFFEPGDVVGIKVVPNGQPDAHSSFEIVLEVIEKLKAAGVKTGDMFVYDRFRGEFMEAGYHKILPGGVRWGGLDPEGPTSSRWISRRSGNDPIAGFDHDTFVWMDLIPYGDDPKDDRKYRSHLGKLVTKTVNKIVAIPVLKDHGSAGVTGALKNMSHGTVNNVARSHSNTFTNVCNQFIPQMVVPPDHPPEVRPADHGRHPRRLPGGAVFARRRQVDLGVQRDLLRDRPGGAWTMSSGTSSMRSGSRRTSPLSPRRAGKAIDPLKTEGFDVRQPQHIALAGASGARLL